MNQNKLNSNILDDLNKILHQIENRVDYIFNQIENIFCVNLNGWYISRDNEKEAGDSSKILKFFFLNYNDNDINIIDKFNNDCNLKYGFPRRWLFEDFEDELRDGKILFDKKQKIQNKYNRQIIKSIKNKLTKEEIDFLNVNI